MLLHAGQAVHPAPAVTTPPQQPTGQPEWVTPPRPRAGEPHPRKEARTMSTSNLREQRANIWEQMKALSDRATRRRTATRRPEETVSYNKMEADLDALGNRIEREERRARRSCSITPKLTPLPPCTATPAGLSLGHKRLVLKQNRKFARRSCNGIGGFFCYAHHR